MNSFEELKLSKQLLNALGDLNLSRPTPIQEMVHPVILSGKDVVGIAQTGTGKTFAYLLAILKDLKFSKQFPPRVLILVPTRELVLQVVEQINLLTKYLSIRALGIYGGTNINTQKRAIAQGTDILVATPGRLYDIALTGVLSLKSVKKLVIDEVDIMLDLGFIYQLSNIFEILPERRQNMMFSATMTDEVDALIDDYFLLPKKISIALSGTPLHNISQACYEVPNFYTKINLLKYLISDKENFPKVLVFMASKKKADLLFELLEEEFGHESCIIHSNKSQNYRIRSIKEFDEGKNRILIATDVMARGLDLDRISHVFNFDTPNFPENYMHRIGRTGRAEKEGQSILFYTKKEKEAKEAIEALMSYSIPELDFPDDVELSSQLLAEERPKTAIVTSPHRKKKVIERGPAFHEKKEKNLKTNQGGSYRFKKEGKYKKPKTKGDKIANKRKKK